MPDEPASSPKCNDTTSTPSITCPIDAKGPPSRKSAIKDGQTRVEASFLACLIGRSYPLWEYSV
eukprot:scaffold263086_cov37-Tisochrysis_lutea.AAC.2